MPSIFFRLGQLGDILDQVGLVDLIGEFGHDDAVFAVVHRLDLHLRLHDHAPTSGAISLFRALGPQNQRGGGEIGSLNKLHQVFGRRLGMVKQVQGGLDHFAEVVRRHAGGHADRDAFATVAQKVGELAGQHDRFRLGLVVVRHEIYRIALDVFQHLHRERGHAALRVTLRRWRIAINTAKIPLWINERVAETEILRHTDQGAINRGVAVRMEFTHCLPHDARRFDAGGTGTDAQVTHGVQNAALHGFEAITSVGQGARDQRGNCVAQVRAAQFMLDIYQHGGIAGTIGGAEFAGFIGKIVVCQRTLLRKRRAGANRRITARLPK